MKMFFGLLYVSLLDILRVGSFKDTDNEAVTGCYT